MLPNSKNQALAEWHALLRDSKRWVNAGASYRFLLGLADRLFAAGQIEPMERFEMVELLTGAFCFHIEETPQAWRIPSADYLVYNEAGRQIGSVSGNRYYLHTPDITPNPVDFFAQIQEAEGDHPVITRTYEHYGVFRDRYIFTETGQTLRRDHPPCDRAISRRADGEGAGQQRDIAPVPHL